MKLIFGAKNSFTFSTVLPISVVSFLVLPVGSIAHGQDTPGRPALNVPAEPPSNHKPDGGGDDSVKGSIVMAKVFFISPKDGAKVHKSFTVKFGTKGVKVVPAGTAEPGTGHHHLIMMDLPRQKARSCLRMQLISIMGKARLRQSLS